LDELAIFVDLQGERLEVFAAGDSPAFAGGLHVGALNVVGNVSCDTLRNSQSIEQPTQAVWAFATVAPAETVEPHVALLASNINDSSSSGISRMAILSSTDVL